MRTRDKRYAGDWLPKDRTAERKGRVHCRFVKHKSDMEKASDQQWREDKAMQKARKTPHVWGS